MDDARRFRALLQPDPRDAGRCGLVDDVQRSLGQDDDQDGMDRFRQRGERAMAPLTVDHVGVWIDRVDLVAFTAQFARRRIPKPLPGPGHADHGDRRFGKERIDVLDAVDFMTGAPLVSYG